MGAIDGLSICGTVSSIGGGFGLEDVGLGIHYSEGAHVIGEFWLEVGGECRCASLAD